MTCRCHPSFRCGSCDLLPDIQKPRRRRDDQRGDQNLDLVDGAGVLLLGVQHDERDEGESAEGGEDEDGAEGNGHAVDRLSGANDSHVLTLHFFAPKILRNRAEQDRAVHRTKEFA
jgi:hypothetical protein